MSSSNQSSKSYEENIAEYYEKWGKIEKISITDSKLPGTFKNTDIKRIDH